MESDQRKRRQLEHERAATARHRDPPEHGNQGYHASRTARNPPDKALLVTPGVAVPTPSNEGRARSLPRSRRGRARGQGGGHEQQAQGEEPTRVRGEIPGLAVERHPCQQAGGGRWGVEESNLADKGDVEKAEDKREAEGGELVVEGV